MTAKPYLNLGSGRTKFPGERPVHHALVPEAIYDYPHWLNISKNASEEPDCVMDLFAYPWALESNAYGGALLSHLVEHIPHEITITVPNNELKKYAGSSKGAIDKHFARYKELAAMQDGWYAFFAELYRVLTPGAMVYILSPFGWSNGAITDPTHTRYLTEFTFTHSMQPDPNSPFEYATGGINFRMVGHSFGLTHWFQHLAPQAFDSPETVHNKQLLLQEALSTRLNVVSDLYVQLECVK